MLVSKDERGLQKGRDQTVASANGSMMHGSSDMQKSATEKIHKSCTKDEKLPQRRLVPTAANEVLYQRSSVLKAEHTRTHTIYIHSTTQAQLQRAHTQIQRLSRNTVCSAVPSGQYLYSNPRHTGLTKSGTHFLACQSFHTNLRSHIYS